MPPCLPTTPTCCAGVGEGFRGDLADGVAEADVGYDAVGEEAALPRKGAVDELIGNDEVGGLVLFLQRPHSGSGQDEFDAELLEPVNIGAEVELAGRDAVAAAVTGQEGDGPAVELAYHVGVRGLAEGGVERDLAQVGDAGHGVKPAAADDADGDFFQDEPLLKV